MASQRGRSLEDTEGKRRLGALADRGSIIGDIVAPAGVADDWDALGG